MKKGWIILVFLIIFILIGIIIIFFNKTTENSVSVSPCSYVFKTNTDYSGLLTISYYKDKDEIAGLPVISIKKLSGDYYYGVYGCGIDFTDNTIVTNLTYDGLHPPTNDEIRESIIDYKPFTEMYECMAVVDIAEYGYVYTESDLRNIVENNELNSKCTKIEKI